MGTTHAAAAVAVAFAVLLLLSPRARDEFALPEAAEQALDPSAEEQRIEIVRIEMPPEPDPEPEPRATPATPPPPPEPPAPPSEPAKTVPEADVLARGESLLRAGTFPRLRATYSRIGFPAYRDAVLALGGAFFLFDPTTRQPVAEVDPRTGAVRAERVRVDLSRWPRDVTRVSTPHCLARSRTICVRWASMRNPCCASTWPTSCARNVCTVTCCWWRCATGRSARCHSRSTYRGG